MKKLIVVSSLSIILSGCASFEEQCIGEGYSPNAPGGAFSDCIVRKHREAEVNAQQWAAVAQMVGNSLAQQQQQNEFNRQQNAALWNQQQMVNAMNRQNQILEQNLNKPLFNSPPIDFNLTRHQQQQYPSSMTCHEYLGGVRCTYE